MLLLTEGRTDKAGHRVAFMRLQLLVVLRQHAIATKLLDANLIQVTLYYMRSATYQNARHCELLKHLD